RSAEGCKQEAFREQLCNEPLSTCAQRVSHGHFALSDSGASQQQVHHVRAGNQQDENQGSGERQKHGTGTCCILGTEGIEIDLEADIARINVGMLVLELVSNADHILLGLSE